MTIAIRPKLVGRRYSWSGWDTVVIEVVREDERAWYGHQPGDEGGTRVYEKDVWELVVEEDRDGHVQ